MSTFSPRFYFDGRIRVGAMILIHTSEGYSLQTVMQVNESQPENGIEAGLHLCEFEPGREHEVKFYTYDQCYFPIPLAANQMTSGQSIGALYDLQPDPNALSGPDFTTIYYDAIVNKSQKGVPKGQKGIVYLNADGSKTQANLPIEAYLPGELEPFPTCVRILNVNQEHIRASMEIEQEQQEEQTVEEEEEEVIEESTSTPTPTPTIKLVLKESAPSTVVVASSPPVHPPPTMPIPPPSIPAQSATPDMIAPIVLPAATDSLKRRRASDLPMTDESFIAAPSSPSLTATQPIAGVESPSTAAKRSKKLHKKDFISIGTDTKLKSALPEYVNWHCPLPADPRTFAVGPKWTVESLSSVIPALNSIDPNNKSDSSPPPTAASLDTLASISDHSSNLSDHPTEPLSHALATSLAVELSNWDSLQAQLHQTNPTHQLIPSSSFISYRSSMGALHYFDQLKRIQSKQLIAAPYVLDYVLD